MYLLPTLNLMLAVGSVALLIATVVLFVDYFVYKGHYFAETVQQMQWFIVIGITVGSVVLSLVYSEYFGFIPCSLCWLQRIAIYPQALLSVLAFKVRDAVHFPIYGIWLSIFGAAVALYQYVYQMLPKEVATSEFVPCLADVIDADCAVKVIDEFGFVTFPFISLVSFVFLIVIYLYMRKAHS